MSWRIPSEVRGQKQNLRVLLPMDFREGSWEALEYGVRLIREAGGFITILNVVDDSSQGPFEGPPDWKGIHAQQARERREHFFRIKQEYGDQIQINFAIETGSAGEVISDFADKNEFDAIVLSPHLHHWWQIFHRHTVRRVLEHPCGCPVHLVMLVPMRRMHPLVEIVRSR